jgi:hypothetical protein
MLGAPYAHHAISAYKLVNPDGDELLELEDNRLTFNGTILSTGSIRLSGFSGDGTDIQNINASSISSGTFPADGISLTAGHFTSGTIPQASLPDLSSRISNIDASKFTQGTLNPSRLPATIASANRENIFTARMEFQSNAALTLDAGDLVMNNRLLRLAGSNSGLDNGWLGYLDSFRGESVDGPVLSTGKLGVLGVRKNGNHRTAMTWDSNGRVTILGHLEVNGGSSDGLPNTSKGRRYRKPPFIFGGSVENYTVKPITLRIFAEGRVLAFAFGASSDGRAKTILAHRHPGADSKLLDRLRVVDYSPLHGTERLKGFIAQEVAKVIPDAVTRDSKLIEDIMTMAVTMESPVDGLLRFKLPTPHALQVGDVVGICIAEEASEHKIVRVDCPESFAISNPGNAAASTMVLGRRIDDFHVLDYDRIFLSGLHVTQDLLSRTTAQGERLQAVGAHIDSHGDAPARNTLDAARATLEMSRQLRAASAASTGLIPALQLASKPTGQ